MRKKVHVNVASGYIYTQRTRRRFHVRFWLVTYRVFGKDVVTYRVFGEDDLWHTEYSGKTINNIPSIRGRRWPPSSWRTSSSRSARRLSLSETFNVNKYSEEYEALGGETWAIPLLFPRQKRFLRPFIWKYGKLCLKYSIFYFGWNFFQRRF